MYNMTLIEFYETVEDKITGQSKVVRRVEVAGTNMLMKLVEKAIPYTVLKEFKQ